MRARVVERQIVRHLTHLIPYLTPSPVTTLIHPFLRYAFLQPDPLTLHTPFSPILPLSLPLHRPLPPLFPPYLARSPLPSSAALSLDSPRCAAASKALDYLPLISARVAHLLPRLPRLPRPKDQPPPNFLLRTPFRPSAFSTVHPYFLSPTTFVAHCPHFPSFLPSVLFSSTAAILINALTLPLHNYACPLPDSGGSNNTISRVYRELLILGTMSPCSASLRSIRLDLTAIERLPKQAAVN